MKTVFFVLCVCLLFLSGNIKAAMSIEGELATSTLVAIENVTSSEIIDHEIMISLVDITTSSVPTVVDVIATTSLLTISSSVEVVTTTVEAFVTTTVATSTYLNNIFINEVVANPVTGQEWVELWLTTSSLDLSRLKICDSTAKSCKSVSSTMADYMVVDLQTNRYLNNSSDKVILKLDDLVLDKVEYGSELSATKGESLAWDELDGKWKLTNIITKGEVNKFLDVEKMEPVQEVVVKVVYPEKNEATPLKEEIEVVNILNTDVSIVELLPNPVGNDTEGEYIIIHNNSSSTVDLQEWRIKDKSRYYVIQEEILAGKDLILERITTNIALNNNGGEVVELLAPNGDVIDKVGYNKAASGARYVREGEEWQWIGIEVEGEELKISGKINTSSVASEVEEEQATSTLDKENVEYPAITIYAARQLDKGNKVEVEGIVTALPGNLGSQYMYISDNDGGIQIYSYKKLFPALQVGDDILVRGEISEAGDIKRIKIKDAGQILVQSRSNSEPVVSSSLDSLDESMIGQLVKVQGEVTELKSGYFYIDDGSGELKVVFKKGSAVKKQDYAVGQQIQVRGIFEFNISGWQLMPRSSADIVATVIMKEDKDVSANDGITVGKKVNKKIQVVDNEYDKIKKSKLIYLLVAIVIVLVILVVLKIIDKTRKRR